MHGTPGTYSIHPLHRKNSILVHNSSPLQVAVASMLEIADSQPYNNEENYWKYLCKLYEKKMEKTLKVVENAKFMKPIRPEGAFYVIAEVSQLIEELEKKNLIIGKEKEREKGKGKVGNVDWQLMEWLAKNVRVTAIPLSNFTTHGYDETFEKEKFMRFSYCLTDDAFEESQKRM